MKKIEVQGLGTAYIGYDKHDKRLFKQYKQIEVWKIFDTDIRRYIYSTDITSGEFPHGEPITVLVSNRILKREGLLR
jgi:hypothetical protein